MKFKKIVGFGDSWIWGDELLDPAFSSNPRAHPVMHENNSYRESHCFLGLLGQHYDVPVENFGIPGGSQQSAIWTYLWWLEHEKLNPAECLILIGHTESNRNTFYNPGHVSYGDDPPWDRFIHSAWVHSSANNISSEWTTMVKSHMVLTSCDELQSLNYRQSVAFFEGQYNSLSKNLLQFNTLHPPLVATASNLLWPNIGLRNLVNNRNLLARRGHPTEHGHEVIRDHLIPEIERVILA
jgi:hypothetical protein